LQHLILFKQVANHYFDGGAYPVGGCAEIARAMVPTVLASGGDVLVRARVDEVVVENGAVVGVRLAKSGRVVKAPVVVSACGAVNTYCRLLPPEHRPPDIVRLLSPGGEPGGGLVSCGHVMLFVALDSDGEGLPACNYWVSPSADIDANVEAHRRDPENEE